MPLVAYLLLFCHDVALNLLAHKVHCHQIDIISAPKNATVKAKHVKIMFCGVFSNFTSRLKQQGHFGFSIINQHEVNLQLNHNQCNFAPNLWDFRQTHK